MVGVMDLGSNSFISLVVDGRKELLEEVRTTKLASKFDGKMIRGCKDARKVFEEMISKVRNYTDNIWAFGTAVFRRALNGFECLDEIAGEIPHRILSEEEEARYSFLSVYEDDEISVENPVVIDLGGGSLEIVTQDFHTSLPIGTWSIRVDKSTDPIRAALEISESLEIPDGELVGLGGTFVTIAAFKVGVWDLRAIHGSIITRDDVLSLLELLRSLDPEDVETLPFVPKGRGATLMPGCIITLAIMESSRHHILVSRRGYRYALAWRLDRCSDR